MKIANQNGVKDELMDLLLKKQGITKIQNNFLVRRSETGPVPLSYAQQRLWFVDQLNGSSVEYNMPEALRLRGELNLEALEQAIQEIVARHESLRTHFREVDGAAVQVIEPALRIALPVEDLSDLDDAAQQQAVAAARQRDREEPFDLQHGPLMRVKLLRLGREDHILLRTFHHIVWDAVSAGVFNREFATLYEAFCKGRENPLKPLSVQYADFALWQRSRLEGATMTRGLNYWKEQLAGVPDRLTLPMDRPRPAVQTFAAEMCSIAVPGDKVTELKELSWANQATLFMTLLAGYAVLLERYSGKGDIVVGSPIANRKEAQVEQMIGFFVNSLVMRMRVNPKASFRELLMDVRRTCLDAYAFQEIPFERLVEELSPERSLNTTPLFQIVFALQSASTASQRIEGLEVDPLPGEELLVRYDLEVHAIERNGGLEIHWLYNRDLFNRSRIEQLGRHFVTLLEAVIEAPDLPLHRIEILNPSERTTVLDSFNATAFPIPTATLPELFEKQVDRDPEGVALVLGGELLTYRELNTQANRLAHDLMELGVGPETFVGVALERSFEMVITLIGILKAGGAYLPIEGNLPDRRRNNMVADSGLRYLVTLDGTRRLFEDIVEHVVTFDRNAKRLADRSDRNPAASLTAGHGAYVNYTSGSTGEPKGVLVPHVAVVRLVLDPDYVQLKKTSRFLQLAPLNFDAATFEIWGALLNGATLVIVPPGPVSAEEISAVLVDQQVDTLWLTAGLFNQLVDNALPALSGVRQMLTGGEVLSVEHVEKFRRAHPQCQLINGYGPTENTTFSSCHRVSAEEDLSCGVPIGSPISNTRVYVLDVNMEPTPVGVAGELYLAGAGLARGYLNRPSLTAERFLADPHGHEPGGRMYRTGDLARWRADGVLEFLGRTDQQIKIRGFRIELGEIDAALRACPGVQNAVTIMRENETGKQLIAYLVPQPGIAMDLVEVRTCLGGRLPAYMLPSNFVVTPALPLNANGKVDREALPTPENHPSEKYVAPQLPDEELLAGIWSHVLRTDKIGLHDNFFERGGHSLLATQLISRVRDAFNTVVSLRLLFDNPTLAQFASALRLQRSAEWDFAPPLGPTPRQGDPPLSFGQERLWFLNQLEPENPFYNVSLAIRLNGFLDTEALESALTQLVQRHETLRTSFQLLNGRCVQVIAASVVVPLPVFDLTAIPADRQECEVDRLAETDARKPFDLSHDLLVRTHLLRLGPESHVLLLSMHHIVSDGWSMGVLTHDLSELYNAARERRDPILPILAIQYVDFARWQREWLCGEVLDRQLAYWKAALAGAPPDLKFPADRPRPAIQSFRGRLETFEVDSNLTTDLRRLSNESGTSLFMTLLAGFSVLLARYSDQWDLVIGSPIANRTRSELEPLIGFFVNTLALRLRLAGNQTFREVLAQTRRVALDAYAHQDLPFERLVDELQTERDLSRNPIFQVMFTLQNAPHGKRRFEGLEIEPIKATAVSAQFDLVLDIWETEPTLTCVLEYSTDLFDRATVVRLLCHYRNILAEMVSGPDQTVSSVQFIDADERRCLLDGFNPVQKKYPTDRTLQELFEEQVARGPGRVAIIDHHSELSYGALNARANRIAHLLLERGVERGQFVGILDDRGCDCLASMLGVLKAGCAFLPLDPAYPEERLRFMVADSQITTLITRRSVTEKLLSKLEATNLRYVIDLGGHGPIPGVSNSLRWYSKEELDRSPAENPKNRNASGDVAYLLYTSGSTGLPKGAMVRHDGALNHIFGEFELLSFHRNSAFLQSAPCSSDISVWQFLAPGLIGGRVVVVNFETTCDARRLFGWIREKRVTLIELVPVVLGGLLDHVRALTSEERALPDLECAMVTGETVSVPLVSAWLELYPGVPIVNAFGPTEAADDVCQCAITEPLPPHTANVPIGRPLPNVWLYVLDRALNLVPVGVPGEICVSGIAVGNGYWNDSKGTKERFVPNPYSGNGRGCTLYRTGDLGRWMSNGSLEYLGRFDDQVKLRGFRIELGEIEGVLTQHPAVREAVVLARTNDAGEKSLAAYIVPQLTREASDRIAPLEEEQIALWSSLHDNSYGAAPQADPAFNCIGWDSNYTGQPLPEADMREYVATAVSRILSLRPRRVLEIGCGTGLLAFQLIPRCEDYLGIDSSGAAIDQLQQLQRSGSLRARVPGLDRASFVCCRADCVGELESKPFDVAILPSVIQYFPSLDYLEKAVRQLVDIVAPVGSIFIGDVRNLELLEAFHTSVQLFKSAFDLPVRELRRRIERGVAHEQELCVHAAWFRTLPQRIPGIASVNILPKSGRCLNELTRFRYDAVIRLGPKFLSDCVPDWIDGDRFAWGDFDAGVRAGQRSRVAIRSVPNARVREALCAVESLARIDGNRIADDLRARAVPMAAEGLDPEDVWEFAVEHDYLAEVALSARGEPGSFDVLLAPAESIDAKEFCQGLHTAIEPESMPQWSDFANQPLLEKVAREWVPVFRSFLKGRVPSHMVPSNFVVLDRLPLSPAGKIDRHRLPEPRGDTASGQNGAELESDQERALASIWRSVLGLASVGRVDNFFELGGHSLKATQVVSRIQKEFGITISLREVFNNPTIAEFAPFLDGDGTPGSEFIPRSQEAEHYALSHAQRRLWILHQMEPQSWAYNMPSGVVYQGVLDRAAFERALRLILRRHESLRTVFLTVAGEPRQRVLSEIETDLPFIDLRREPMPLERARQIADEEARRPFDLTRGPLFRLKMMRVDDERHIFLSTLHHIVSDDWSGQVMARELRDAYAALVRGDEPEFDVLRIQYRDYAAWQNALLDGNTAREHRDHWLGRLDGELPVLDLPIDRPRPAVKTFLGASVSFEWDDAFSSRLGEFGRQNGASLFMTLVAAVTALLHRYTGQSDIIVGSPVAGRTHADLEPQIGFYVNTLPLRHRPRPEMTFREFLEQVVQSVTDALDHQIYPFDKLVNELNLQRDVSRSPLFDVMVVLQNGGLKERQWPGLQLMPFDLELTTSQFDLTFSFEPSSTGLMGEIKFNTDLFERSRIERMVGHLRNIANAGLTNPQTRLDRLPMISSSELSQLLDRPRRLSAKPANTVVERFEVQAERSPEAIALVFENERLSYAELNSRANQLARRLRGLGVLPGTFVAIYMERSLELVVGLIGILKAGAAYVPLDPAYPKERLALILEDAQAPVVLTQSSLIDDLPELSARVVLLDEDWPMISLASSENPGTLARLEDTAYVIYTSGSTGKPKGVMVSHSNVVRLFSETEPWFHPGESDVWTLFHSCAFDFSVWEIWGALLYGGRLVVVPRSVSRAPDAFHQLLCAEGVTVLNQTPSAFRQLIDVDRAVDSSGLRLRYVIFGGEALNLRSLRPWFERHGDQSPQLVNMYGITETTVHVTYRALTVADVDSSQSVIGSAIPDLQVYLVDRYFELVPIGMPGEICVGGPGLAAGYLGQPDLTADRFVPDPFGTRAGARLYRSGDLARYLPDGDIEYLGRIDHQVKIRGFRIELGDVQAALASHPKIEEGLVILRERSPDEKVLVAYCVLKPGEIGTTSEIRNFLKARLPDYMVPARVVILPAFPLTANGKIDVRSLPEPDQPSSARRGVEDTVPLSPVEQAIADIWRELLHLEGVGMEENFFDLGGDSLLIIQAHESIRTKLGCEISVLDMFRYPTIRAFSEYLSGSNDPFQTEFDRMENRITRQREARQRRHSGA